MKQSVFISTLALSLGTYFISSGQSCSIGKQLRQAGNFSIPTQAIVIDALEQCSASSKIDSADNILLLLNIADYAASKKSAGSTTPYDYKKVHDETYKQLRSTLPEGEAQRLATQTATLNDPQTSSGLLFLALIPVGGKLPAGEAKEKRRDVIRFRAYYKSGNWKKAVKMEQNGAAQNSPLLCARAISRALEEGKIEEYDAPHEHMNKNAYAQEALSYYNQVLSSLDKLPLSSSMKQKIKLEAESWKKKAETGNYN